MQKLKIFLYAFLTMCFMSILETKAQTRQSTYNNIGWYCYFGDHKISKKWGIHTEYQWRRTDFITSWQQSLARVGVNYNIHPKVMLTLGYGYINTFTYGEYDSNAGISPISRTNRQGKEQDFPEHRFYVDALVNNDLTGFELNHRFRYEQRYMGLFYDDNNDRLPDEWKLFHRLRYRVRGALPLKGKTIDPKEFYLHAYDELFIGFGKDVGFNIFDQNRINIGVGYKIDKHAKIEVGFFSQTVQRPALINKPLTPIKSVFEYNQGFLIAFTYNFDFSKKEEPKKEEEKKAEEKK